MYTNLVHENDPDARLTTLDIRINGDYRIHFAADAQDEYNLGPTAPLDANADGISDLLVYFSDRYGSGRDAYGALLLGCGAGNYVYSGTILLGPAGSPGQIEAVPGGLLVKRIGRPPADDPATVSRFFPGYCFLPKSYRLVPASEHPNRCVVVDDLKRNIE